MKTGRQPRFLWVDRGREIWNQDFTKLLEEKGINLYSTENEEKSSVFERWNRTMKNKMWKLFTASNSTVCCDKLPQLVKSYNQTKYRSIKMTPEQASKKDNEDSIYLNLDGKGMPQTAKPKFKVGDKVKISRFKRKIFDMGYTPSWTEEIFVIDKTQFTSPVTYKIKDLSGENILESFYEPELSTASQEVFRVEKVLKGNNYKNKRAFVKWSGYCDKWNS